MARSGRNYNPLGHFDVSVATGAIGAGMAADGELFQFLLVNAGVLALVYEISITGMRATTAFAAGAIDIKATIARAWIAVGTGGSTLTLTGNQAQLRTNMDTSLMHEIRVATTAALGAGTKTLDTQDIGQIVTHSSGGFSSATPIIGSIYLPHTTLFKADLSADESPIVIAPNEGFVVRATVPITGVWNLGIRVKWAETTGSRY